MNAQRKITHLNQTVNNQHDIIGKPASVKRLGGKVRQKRVSQDNESDKRNMPGRETHRNRETTPNNRKKSSQSNAKKKR